MPQLSTILAAAIALAVGAHTPTIAAPQASAPTVTEAAAPARLTARLPDSILRAEEAAKINLDYTAAAGDTYYFDADSNPVDKATAGGYYRKTLGKTADGRLVVQDYYQDGDKPQAAPVILKKGANPHSFANDINDSKTVWYRKDGSIEPYKTLKTVFPPAATATTKKVSSPWKATPQHRKKTIRTVPQVNWRAAPASTTRTAASSPWAT